MAVRAASDVTRGQIYNLGGGMELAVSVIEMLHAIERETGKSLNLQYSAVRPGDQPLYISDTSKVGRQTGWRPSRSVPQIIEAIHRFWRENRSLFAAWNEPAAQAAELAQGVA
jgi:CDP-paratose 2-epimerase